MSFEGGDAKISEYARTPHVSFSVILTLGEVMSQYASHLECVRQLGFVCCFISYGVISFKIASCLRPKR
jgi:hypothetical protein